MSLCRASSMLSALLLMCLSILGSGAAAAAAAPTAVFPFDLIDDSQEGAVNGVRADQTQRLKLITEELRSLLKDSGRFRLVDMTPIAGDIAKAAPVYKCNGCEDDLARKVGASKALIGTVQKVSNLILNLNVYVRDVNASKIVQEYSVDMRGNTDESWLRAVRYLVKNRLLADGGTSQ